MTDKTAGNVTKHSSRWEGLGGLSFLIHKEFLQIRRNAFLPRLIIMFPIVIMCVMPWVMSMEVKNIRVSVVDNDRTTQSQRLVHAIEASRYFIFCGQKPSYQAALAEVEKGDADIILEIKDGRYLIAANAVNGTKGGMGSAYLSNIIVDELTSKQVDELTSKQVDELAGKEVLCKQSAPSGRAGKLATLNLYNKHQNYKLFMIPALLAIVMMLMTGFLPTLNIVGEKEAGTIEQMNVTPVSKWAFILSKLIPYWLIAIFVVTVSLVLAWAVYGITCAGSLLWVYVLAMLLALFFSSLGLIISNYSDTMQQAIFVMWFFVVCIMLLSGLFTPTRSMPWWAYLTTYVNPMHYFIDAIRTVFIRGGGFTAIAHQLLALALIGIFMSGWAVASYKKNS
jgi:ABC-2 type transport system permease protein